MEKYILLSLSASFAQGLDKGLSPGDIIKVGVISGYEQLTTVFSSTVQWNLTTCTEKL